MSDETKCKLCSETAQGIGVYSEAFCESCYEITCNRSYAILFAKLISRIEKLESEKNELQESYRGLFKDTEFIIERLDKFEQFICNNSTDIQNLYNGAYIANGRLEKFEQKESK